jgi:hypothetical protein
MGAKAFVRFLLSPDGSSILQRDGLDRIKPVAQWQMIDPF